MKIGITIGDFNGIGPEVIIKALSDERFSAKFTPIIYGSSKVMAYHKNIVSDVELNFFNITSAERSSKDKINVINCWDENVNITLGKATEDGGKYAYIALDRAVQDLKNGLIDALVTAPINKEAMKMANFPYPGHTEFIENALGGKSLMMMVSDDLRIGLVTNHLPIKDVVEKINKNTILEKLFSFNNSLSTDFGIDKPIIAVMGFNPHSGDNGTIGREEEEIIRPAIIEAKKSGILVTGPYSADGFFGGSMFKRVDGILAMYHDQGLIPFKALTFGTGVNFTAGLNQVRTSPDHGTAYDLAGKNEADAGSMIAAIYKAMEIYAFRKEYVDLRKNSLKKKERPMYTEEEDEILEEA